MKRLTVDRAQHLQSWEGLMWKWTGAMPRKLLFNDLFEWQGLDDI